jgi:uncharacterized membrane protein YedE/YeeE
MDMNAVREYLEPFRTERIVTLLQEINLGDLLYNRWFLAAMALFTIVALSLRRQALVLTVLAALAFACLVDYSLQKNPAIDRVGSEPVLVFVGGGLVLIFVMIYFLFIKHD